MNQSCVPKAAVCRLVKRAVGAGAVEVPAETSLEVETTTLGGLARGASAG